MQLNWASMSMVTRCWPQMPTSQDLLACLGVRAHQAHQDPRGALDSPVCQALLDSQAHEAQWDLWGHPLTCLILSKAGGALWVHQEHQEDMAPREREERLGPQDLRDPRVLSTSCCLYWPTFEMTSQSCRRRYSDTGLTLRRRTSPYLRNSPATQRRWTLGPGMTTPEGLNRETLRPRETFIHSAFHIFTPPEETRSFGLSVTLLPNCFPSSLCITLATGGRDALMFLKSQWVVDIRAFFDVLVFQELLGF